ncbi:MAG TPA: hypothetical protein VFS44_08495 [Gemmatimonadaceae bacterium]|nr:hypothetical protein [Gemmatimonadaceae bacterium]
MTDAARGTRGAILAGLTILAMAACTGEEKGPNGTLKLSGTVHMVQSQDGGTCWKLESSKGKTYELQPAQVPHDMLVDGAKVKMLAKPRKGGSFCNVGQIIDVTQVDSMSGPEATASSQ